MSIDGKYTNPHVTYDGIHWWISVGIETKVATQQNDAGGIGIDVGIKDLSIYSNNNKIPNINKTKAVKRLKNSVDCNTVFQKNTTLIRKEIVAKKQSTL